MLIIVILFCSFKVVSAATIKIDNFYDVKKQAKIIWQDHRITFYCGCSFDKHLNVNHASCGYAPQDMKRAKRVEWEHIVPVSWFGAQRPCWRDALCKHKNAKSYSGRNCCEKIDPEFRKMYYDLHNLVPAIGEVNKARQNYRFVELNVRDKIYNGCELYINDDLRIVVPKDELKGMIARAYLYMAKTYPFKLNKNSQKLFITWHKQYPPSAWEIEWNKRVKAVQGTDNVYISAFEQRRPQK